MSERCPFPTGVIRGPFRPTLLRFTESMALCGIPNFPSGFWKSVNTIVILQYILKLPKRSYPDGSDIDSFPFDRDIGGSENLLNGSRDLRSDAIARDQRNFLHTGSIATCAERSGSLETGEIRELALKCHHKIALCTRQVLVHGHRQNCYVT